jgi:hypothetical protein
LEDDEEGVERTHVDNVAVHAGQDKSIRLNNADDKTEGILRHPRAPGALVVNTSKCTAREISARRRQDNKREMAAQLSRFLILKRKRVLRGKIVG